VIAFGEKQLQDHLAVFLQALGVGGHLHAFFHSGHTGREQAVLSLDFDQTHPASANIRETIHLTEARDKNSILAGHIHDALVLAAAQVPAIDLERLDARGRAHG